MRLSIYVFDLSTVYIHGEGMPDEENGRESASTLSGMAVPLARAQTPSSLGPGKETPREESGRKPDPTQRSMM